MESQNPLKNDSGRNDCQAKRKKNDCLNALKGIACIAVVLLHVGFSGRVGDYMAVINAIGVPIFFMVSGFFTQADDLEKMRGLCWRRSKHIVKMLGVAVLIYFVSSMLHCYLDGGIASVRNWFTVFTIKNVAKLIALNMTSFVDGWGIMWFMLALIYCYVAYYLICMLFRRSESYYVFIPILLGFHLAVRYTFNLVGITYGSVYFQNWLFDGLPFFLLGNYIAKYKDKVSFLSKLSSAIIVAIVSGFGITLSILEFQTIGHCSFYFGTVIAVIGLFTYAATNPESGKGSFLALFGSKYSMVIYLSHTLIHGWIKPLFDFEYSSWLLPWAVLLGSVIIAIIFDSIKGRFEKMRRQL